METIKFKTANLANYTVITKPGLYILESLSNVTESNLVADDDGKNPRYIANFKAIAADKLPQVKQVFDGKAEVDIEQTNGLFLSANVWKREGQTADLPMKGEKVECTVDLVSSREGDQVVLRITNIKRRPASVGEKIDLVSFFAPVAATGTAPAGAPAEKTLAHA